MASVLNKTLTLSLNKNWLPIKEVSVRRAIENMTSNRTGTPPEFGVDMEWELDADGSPDYDKLTNLRVVSWEEWLTLPVRPYDLFVQAGRTQVRAPTVIICSKFHRVPNIEPKFSKRAVFERDGLVDQYSGERIADARDANLDHVIPQSLGGKNSFENVVVTRRSTNSMKGNRRNEEVGLKLIRTPVRPKAKPVTLLFKTERHPSWRKFLVAR